MTYDGNSSTVSQTEVGGKRTLLSNQSSFPTFFFTISFSPRHCRHDSYGSHCRDPDSSIVITVFSVPPQRGTFSFVQQIPLNISLSLLELHPQAVLLACPRAWSKLNLPKPANFSGSYSSHVNPIGLWPVGPVHLVQEGKSDYLCPSVAT